MPRESAWDPGSRQPPPFCSSEDFVRQLREEHPELVVPEHDVVYLGLGQPSSDWDETPPADGDRCACGGRIRYGSLLCCPRCHASGFDRPLARQRELAGMPSPEPKPRPIPEPTPLAAFAPPSPPTRRELRAEKFGRKSA